MNVGIAGYGNIGHLHHKAIDLCDGLELVAVTRHRNAVDVPGVTVHPGIASLVADQDVDIVVICTPSGLHGEQALMALQAGKHVLVEKPLALDLDVGRRVVVEARERGLLLSAVAPRLFEPAIVRLRDVVASGQPGRFLIGEVLLHWHRDQGYYDSAPWRGTRSLDGGVLMNQAIHTLGILHWILGPVAEVAGAAGATITHNMEAEDTAAAVLRFANGGLAVVSATTSSPHGLPGELNLFFERGVVRFHDQLVASWYVEGVPAPHTGEDVGSGADAPMNISHVGLLRQWADVKSALEAHTEPTVTGEEGLAAAALVLAIYQAWWDGRPAYPAHQ